MNEEIGFHIGKEESRLDKPPFRAYFHWTREKRLIKMEDYSKQELEAEIASGQRPDRELKVFKEALNQLALSTE